MRIGGDRPAVAALLLAIVMAAGAALPAAAQEDELALPLTFEKVWYRAGSKKGLAGLRVFKAAGDLTLSREGLEFHGGKDSFSIPLANITMVSFGKLGRDVDTNWAVVGVRELGVERIVAFRDGKALGYGQDTPRIYRSIRNAMRVLSGAQYNVPDGWMPYDRVDDQIAFMVPEDWHVHVPSAVRVDGTTPWGSFLISSRELDGGGELLEARAIRQRLADPDNRELFLLRQEVLEKASCSGLRSKAQDAVLERAAADPMFEDFPLIEPPRSTPLTIADCEGLRVVARGRRADGVEAVLDLRVVARRDTLFTFGLRALASSYDELLTVYEPVVDSARFALAVE